MLTTVLKMKNRMVVWILNGCKYIGVHLCDHRAAWKLRLL